MKAEWTVPSIRRVKKRGAEEGREVFSDYIVPSLKTIEDSGPVCGEITRERKKERERKGERGPPDIHAS